ncbi:MAG: two-component system response regulator RppA [bacterium]|nr:two-component system response regulator RppA [bacterium]
MKILLVEDEEKLAKSLQRGLEQDGYTVDCVFDGETAQKRIELHHEDYDLVILDLMLPKRNGLDICRSIRSQNITIPVLILTARDGLEDRVGGLECGADDYLIKPFSFDELSARIRALLRRPREALPAQLLVRNVLLNPATRKVLKNGKEIPLTLKEFELLEYLMRNKNRAVSREQLFSHVWDFATDSFSNVVDVHIKNLRKKLAENAHEKFIETVRGVGYRIEE